MMKPFLLKCWRYFLVLVGLVVLMFAYEASVTHFKAINEAHGTETHDDLVMVQTFTLVRWCGFLDLTASDPERCQTYIDATVDTLTLMSVMFPDKVGLCGQVYERDARHVEPFIDLWLKKNPTFDLKSTASLAVLYGITQAYPCDED